MNQAIIDCVAPELIREGLSRELADRPVRTSRVEPDAPMPSAEEIDARAELRRRHETFMAGAKASGRRGAQAVHGTRPTTERAKCRVCGCVFERNRMGRPATMCMACRHERRKESERKCARRRREEARDGR